MDVTSEHIYYNNLFDIYGNLLNEREQDIFRLFYEEDLSLQEIAETRKVSKSSIGKAIQIINKKLETYEEKLQIMNKKNKLDELILEIKDDKIREKYLKIIGKVL